MNAAFLGIGGLLCFILAYRYYGRFLSKRIFELDSETSATPAHELKDGIDYVPSKKPILVGHHFSSIAGAAPIVGPAVAAIWGWLPAFLWIVCGVIFMGAAHDFGALVISMKHKGESVGNLSAKILSPNSRSLFLIIIFFLIWMVIAVFTLVIANLFISFPSSVIPVNFEIIIAILMGVFINKKSKSLTLPSIIAQACLFLMIVIGTYYPISLGDNALFQWIVFLMIYSFIASILPVWTLLQPRDYINSHQLFLGLALMIVGLVITSPTVVAPAINLNPSGAPPWFPFLFITIACGALSGFHGLVASGTTSKQVHKWSDAKPIGYGSMLGEGLLALLATLAVTAGFDSPGQWHHHYASWDHANGLNAKISAFVVGASKFVSGVGIPEEISKTVIAVLIISFAATSLDTACRIQRYIIGEFGDIIKVKPLKNRFVGSGLAILSAFFLMISADGGKGGLKLWPLFGATNQMLAGLTLIIIAVYLFRLKRNMFPYLIPAILVIAVTSLSLFLNIKSYMEQNNIFLILLGISLFIAQFFIVITAINALRKGSGHE